MTTKTAAQNLVELREVKDRAVGALEAVEGTLRSLDAVIIADLVLRCGWHPYGDGGGRVLSELLIRRHRSQAPKPPLIPEITQSDVTRLADELGVDRQFDPTRGANVD